MNAEIFLNSLIDFERIRTFDYNFKLANFRRFLKTIGNPQEKLSNVILIAGTKGKGSTAAFIEAGLRRCELKTGLFTSPHILSLRERIKVNNKEISRQDLNRLANKIKKPAQKFNITFFEALTAISFLYFLEKKVDYTVLEVGLGGRLDATNVVKPKISVITRVGYDHTNLLGTTLTQISKEKAGIIHDKSFVVIGKQRSNALKTIKSIANANRSEYLEVEKVIKPAQIKTDLSGTEFYLENTGKFEINLIGRHQVENVCTGLTVLNYLKKQDSRINDRKIKQGIETTEISARCQVVSKKPLIIVDGAHNPESVQALSDVIKNIIKKKAIIIFGASSGKLVKKMFKILSPVTSRFIRTQSDNPRAIPSGEIAKIVSQFNIPFIRTNSVKDALNRFSENAPLVITGSFYVASEALMLLKKKKSI